MTTTSKSLLAFAVVGALAGLIAFFGISPFAKQIITQTFGTSTQGSTGTTARQYNVYGVNLSAPGANATSTSILNSTGNDLYISAIKVGCEGLGTSKTAYTGAALANLLLSVATSSTSAARRRPAGHRFRQRLLTRINPVTASSRAPRRSPRPPHR